MASNRLRSLRNVGTRLNANNTSIGTMSRRPSPRKLAANLVAEGNIRRYAATEPVIAPNAVTSEKIDEGAVGSSELANDAVTGKTIRDSDIIESRFQKLEGEDFTVTDKFDLTNGVIQKVEITGPSKLTGNDIILDQVTLANVLADTISSASGGLSLVGDPVGVSGSFAVSGGTTMTVGGGSFGVDASGSGVTMGGGTVNISAGSFQSFTINGIQVASKNSVTNVENDITSLKNRVSSLESRVSALESISHTH